MESKALAQRRRGAETGGGQRKEHRGGTRSGLFFLPIALFSCLCASAPLRECFASLVGDIPLGDGDVEPACGVANTHAAGRQIEPEELPVAESSPGDSPAGTNKACVAIRRPRCARSWATSTHSFSPPV